MRRFLEASFEQIEPAISESFVKNSLDKAKEFKGLKLIANIFLFIIFGSYAAFGAPIYMGNHMDEAVGGLDVNNEFIPVFSSIWYIHIQILPILIGIGALLLYRNRNRFKGVYLHNIFVGIFMVFFLLLMFKIFQLFVTPFFLRMIYTVLYIFVFIYTIRIGYFNTKNLVFGEAKKRPFLVEWVSQHSKKILSVLFTIGVAYYGLKAVTPSAANMEQRLIGSLADFLPLAIILANFVNLYLISTSIRAYYVHKYSEQFRENLVIRMKSGMDRSIRGFNMKKRILLSASFLILLFLSGCLHYEEKSEELIDYYNGWLMTRDDANLSSMFTLLTTDNNEEAKQLLDEEVLPIFQDSLNYLESIELEFKDNQELYELHVKTEKTWLEFFQEFENQLDETGVFLILEKTDEEQQEINQLVDDFTEKREELMEKYEVYWIIDYDEHGNELDRIGKDR